MKKASKLVGGAALLLSLMGTADSARGMDKGNEITAKSSNKKEAVWPESVFVYDSRGPVIGEISSCFCPLTAGTLEKLKGMVELLPGIYIRSDRFIRGLEFAKKLLLVGGIPPSEDIISTVKLGQVGTENPSSDYNWSTAPGSSGVKEEGRNSEKEKSGIEAYKATKKCLAEKNAMQTETSETDSIMLGMIGEYILRNSENFELMTAIINDHISCNQMMDEIINDHISRNQIWNFGVYIYHVLEAHEEAKKWLEKKWLDFRNDWSMKMDLYKELKKEVKIHQVDKNNRKRDLYEELKRQEAIRQVNKNTKKKDLYEVTDKDIKRHLYEYLDNRHEEMNPRKGEPEGGDNRKALYEHLGTRPGDVQGTVADILQSEKETGETVGGFLLENRKRELDDMKKWLNKIWSGLKKEGIVAGKTRDALYEHLIKRQKEKYAAEQAPFVSKKEVGEIVKTFFRDKENKERENAIEWMRERWLRENNDLGIGGIASMGRDVTLQTLNYASDKGERKEILATSNKCEEWEAYNDKYELCGPYLKEEALAKILDRPEIVNYLGVIIGYAAGGDGEAKKMMDRCIQLTQNASGRYWDVLSNRSREENRYAWCVLLYATLKNVLDSDVLSDETKKVIDKYGIDKKSRIIDLLQKAPCIHRAAATWFVSSTIYTLALQTENIFEYHAGFLQDLWELWFKARPIDAPDTVSIIEAREKEEDLLLLIALSTRTNGIRIDLEKATKKKFLTSGFLYLLRGMSGQLSTGAFDAKGKRESAELYIDILDRIAEWSGQWVTGGKDEAFANLIDIANTKDDYGRGYLIAFMDIVEKTGARLPPYMLKIYESIMKKQKA